MSWFGFASPGYIWLCSFVIGPNHALRLKVLHHLIPLGRSSFPPPLLPFPNLKSHLEQVDHNTSDRCGSYTTVRSQ